VPTIPSTPETDSLPVTLASAAWSPPFMWYAPSTVRRAGRSQGLVRLTLSHVTPLTLVRDANAAVVSLALVRTSSWYSPPWCSGTQVEFESKPLKQGYHISGSRVETRRLSSYMGQLDSRTCAAPPWSAPAKCVSAGKLADVRVGLDRILMPPTL
jgi:hypothetical protein